MSKKNNFLAQSAFYLLFGVLLFYAASRTLHFVQLVMANSTWGYLFLFATGVGSVIWLYVYLSYAKGAKQRGIAFAMGLLDLIGELALVYADTIYVGDKAGLVKMSPDELNVFITVSVVMVGVNIFAGYMFKLWDLQTEQEQHAQDLVDHVTEETMKHLNTPEAKQQMVQQLLPIYRDAIAARVQSEIFARSSTTGIDAQSIGWPLASPLNPPTQEKKSDLPFLSGLTRLLEGGKTQPKEQMAQTSDALCAWNETPKGRERLWCKICKDDGQPWLSPEPCTHVLNAKNPEQVSLETAMNTLRSLMMEQPANPTPQA